MKITDVRIKQFGQHTDFSFTPGEKGLHLIYGPNESGKTTLLQALRSALFGFQPKERRKAELTMQFVRGEKSYQLTRKEKKLEFFPLGEEAISVEPADLWWHGLDRKTYEQVFALTIDDLQGSSFLTDINVRTRFFGMEGRELLSDAVKDLDKATNQLLVASTNGKRKINVLLEKIQQNNKKLAELDQQERIFIDLRQRLENTEITEKELRASHKQRSEYCQSVELVLQAWETYKRIQEAGQKMTMLGADTDLEGEAFLALDEEIKQCDEHMRIWRGKEESLTPENFKIDSPLGTYSSDIEQLYQQLSTWEGLQRDCREGEQYLDKVREQIKLSRKLQTTWRDDLPMPEDVDWHVGEKLAQDVRLEKDMYEQWALREPVAPENMAEETAHIPSEEDLQEMAINIDKIKESRVHTANLERQIHEPKSRFLQQTVWHVLGLLMGIITIVLYLRWRTEMDVWSWGIISLTLIFGAVLFAYGYKQKSSEEAQRNNLLKELQAEDIRQQELLKSASRMAGHELTDMAALESYYASQREKAANHSLDLVRIHNYRQDMKRWHEEGTVLQERLNAAQNSWKRWLPVGAGGAVTENDFFALRQEYEQYREKKDELAGYEERLREYKDKLNTIEEQAQRLWENLELEDEPSVGNLRRLYGDLKKHQQNAVRWEQKESQRKNFREEYDQWQRKKTDLLLRREEIVQKSGLSSAADYRQHLLRQGQYKQWKTIYHQSQEQLKLLAPRKETYDLLCRRLQEGNKEKWLDELRHSENELKSLTQRLAAVYEERGELSESLRALVSDQDKPKALQERSSLEGELKASLTDWLTKILVGKFIEEAQQNYEKEKQPQVLARASEYVHILTRGKYTLEILPQSGDVFAATDTGERLESNQWSSGLGDQIYLALRLSLAEHFGEEVEHLPLILDDVLLRFDEERQQAALELLLEVSKREQIFIFTCQASLVRLAEKMNQPQLLVYELDADGVHQLVM